MSVDVGWGVRVTVEVEATVAVCVGAAKMMLGLPLADGRAVGTHAVAKMASVSDSNMSQRIPGFSFLLLC